MQVIICPHCESKIKFSGANLPPKVTCPGCKKPFAPTAAKGSGQSAPTAASSKKKEVVEDEFDEVDDEPDAGRKKTSKNRDDEDDRRGDKPTRRKDRDDNEDDRGRKRQNRDEQDEDDQRAKKRSNRTDDEDDNRSKKRRERDDDEDDRGKRRKDRDDDAIRENQPPTPEQFKKSLLGLKLLGYSFWAQVAAFGALLLLAVGGSIFKMSLVADIRFIVAVGGVPNWVLGVTAGVFLLLGYKKGNLQILLIALVAVAGIHMLIDFYLAFFGDGKSVSNLLVARGSKGSILWEITATLFFHCQFVVIVGLFPVVLFFGAILELARFVMMMLVLRQYALMCGEKKRAKTTIVLASILVGTFAVSFGLFAALLSDKPDKSAALTAGLLLIAAFASYTTVYVLSALQCGKIKTRMEELAYGDERPARSEKKKKNSRRED